MVEHTTPDPGQMRATALICLICQSPGKEDTAHHALRNRMNQQRLWAAGSIVTRGWGDPWFSWKDVIGLFELFVHWQRVETN